MSSSMPPEGGFREEVLNVFLAILLSDRNILSVPESIRNVPAKGRRLPDITIAEYLGIRVIIEGRILESSNTEKTLVHDAFNRIKEGLSPVCIAVLYPASLRNVSWNEIKTQLAHSNLRVKVITSTSEEEWYDTDVDGLAAILRRAYELLTKEDVVATTVEKLKDAIENSAICLSEVQSIPSRLRAILGIFEPEGDDKNPMSDNLRVCRIASLTLANAFVFQEILSSNEASVKTLRRTLEESNPVNAFSDVWKHILTDIDYIPIFRIAREVLLELPSAPCTDKAIQFLSVVALETTGNRAALKHDLMGRIYHRLLLDAKYYGAFYTTIPAATLLLELTFDPRYWDLKFGNEKDMKKLKIADLACGSGTLLKAALEAAVDDHISAVTESGISPKIIDMHKIFLEDVLWGFDVLPFAVHLAASALALHEPDVSFRRMNLFVLPIGGPDLKLGSLEFLPDKVSLIHVQNDLFGASSGISQVTGYGDETVSVQIPKLDLCVMNPPFTRSVGGNLLFGSYPENQRKEMQKRLKSIMTKDKIEEV